MPGPHRTAATPRRTSLRALTGLAASTVIAVSLAACGSESVVTCSEYASMDPGTGLLTSLNPQQTDALEASLRSAGYDDGLLNRTIGATEVLAYCNIYDGVANANQDQPISNAH